MFDVYQCIPKECVFRYCILEGVFGDVVEALPKFGLRRGELSELDRVGGTELLARLLWKDMAYQMERMPQSTAEEYAKLIVEENSDSKSRYFSNTADADLSSWETLTSSTFDSGLIIVRGDGRFFCIWFEDED